MTFNKAIDRIERSLDLFFYYFRIWFPRRPLWFKFSTFCISTGVLLFSSPWWVPFFASVFEIALENFGAMRADTSFWLSPELYGGLLIVSGILNAAVFFLFFYDSTKLGPFVSASVREDETFLDFTKRIAKNRKKELKLELVNADDVDVGIPAGPVSGPDAARLLRQLAKDSEQAALDSIYITETKKFIILGKE